MKKRGIFKKNSSFAFIIFGYLAVMVVVLGIITAVKYYHWNNSAVVFDQSKQPPVTNQPAVKSPAKSIKAPAASNNVQPNYEQALEQYAGRRIQFNDSCQASPTSMTLKNGSSIMIDNRGATKKTITVGQKSYTLAGYAFTVASLSASELPATIQINCNSQYNVARISLVF